MLRLISDENFNNNLVRRLLRQYSELDLVRVQDVGLLHAPDTEVLEWAANEGRILLTHDVSTVADYAYGRINKGLPMPGVINIPKRIALSNGVFESLCICLECSDADYWKERIEYLPL